MEKSHFQQEQATVNSTYMMPNNNNTTANGGYRRLDQPSRSPQHCCHGAFKRAEMTAKYDDMDLYSLKPNVKVDFEEIFQEPIGSENIRMVWTYNRAIYNWTLRGFYVFLSGLLGPILGIAWALIFAVMNFALIWAVNPALKLVLQACRVVEVLNRGLLRSSLDPVFQSFGQMLASIKGTFTLSLPTLESVLVKMKDESEPQSTTLPTITSSIA